MSTYKTTDPAALTALALHNSKVQEISARAITFKAAWDADSVIYRNDVSSGFRVYGLRFKPEKDRKFWTVPLEKEHRAQRPRRLLKTGATKEERQTARDLEARWEAEFPQGVAKWGKVLESLGTDWGSLFFTGFSLFEHNGAIYMKTGAKLAEHCVEILGSEYDAAKQASEAEK